MTVPCGSTQQNRAVILGGARARPHTLRPESHFLSQTNLPSPHSKVPEQEYFANGMVEEFITALSRNRELFVIAGNSSFTFKGRAVDIKQVAGLIILAPCRAAASWAMEISLIKHEAVPECGSSEVRFSDGRPPKCFYWDDVPSQRRRPEMSKRRCRQKPSREPSGAKPATGRIRGRNPRSLRRLRECDRGCRNATRDHNQM